MWASPIKLHSGWVAQWSVMDEKFFFSDLKTGATSLEFPREEPTDLFQPFFHSPVSRHPDGIARWNALRDLLDEWISGYPNLRTATILVKVHELIAQNYKTSIPIPDSTALFADLVAALEEERKDIMARHSALVDFLYARLKDLNAVINHKSMSNPPNRETHEIGATAETAAEDSGQDQVLRSLFSRVQAFEESLSTSSRGLWNDAGSLDHVDMDVAPPVHSDQPYLNSTHLQTGRGDQTVNPPVDNPTGQPAEADSTKKTPRTSTKQNTSSEESAKFKHQCEICGKRFTRAATLRDHSRAHKGQRPYVCSQCPKAFARSKDRARHQKLHTSKKSIVCGVTDEGWGCGQEFNRMDGLLAHFRTDRGWECVRKGITDDNDAFLDSFKRGAREKDAYRCKLTSAACGRLFSELDELLDHIKAAANKACVAEWATTIAHLEVSWEYELEQERAKLSYSR
jgi:Zinc finger, C2H2 type